MAAVSVRKREKKKKTVARDGGEYLMSSHAHNSSDCSDSAACRGVSGLGLQLWLGLLPVRRHRLNPVDRDYPPAHRQVVAVDPNKERGFTNRRFPWPAIWK